MSRHLGTQVSAYVDHRLDARTQHAFDQHLAVCLVCRHAADEERRLLTSLRSGPMPGFSADLQSTLLALARSAPTACAPSADGGAEDPAAPARGPVPLIPYAPVAARQLRLPTVPPAAPALHRSPRRAAAIAGLAAGASAAAAIGLAVVGPGAGAAASIGTPSLRAPGGSSTAVSAAFSGSVGGAVSASRFTSSPLQQAMQRSGR